MSPSAVQATYYGLNLAGGGTGVVILLLTTLLSRYVKKQPVLINLYCACILESYLACILCVIHPLIRRAKVFLLRTPCRFLSNQYTENEGTSNLLLYSPSPYGGYSLILLVVPKVKIGSSLCMAQAMLFTPTPAL